VHTATAAPQVHAELPAAVRRSLALPAQEVPEERARDDAHYAARVGDVRLVEAQQPEHHVHLAQVHGVHYLQEAAPSM
jgi:hypothetical protein